MSLKVMEPKKLYVYSWGDGIGDVRYFTPQILMPSELKAMAKATGYTPQAYDLPTAIKALELTMKDAEPGIYFAGNPLEGTYGKWNIALKKAGWHQVPGCALNRVWGNWRNFHGPADKAVYTNDKTPWNSPDGQNKWIHAFYYIVPGRKKAISWDFTEKTRNLKASNGDADLTHGAKGSLWQIDYCGGGTGKHLSGLGTKFGSGPRWCPNFARLSKSCGIAMGYGLPECGAALDEEFFTIASQELDKAWPKGWSPFVEYGGHSFAHNIAKLPTTGLMKCPHPMEVAQ